MTRLAVILVCLAPLLTSGFQNPSRKTWWAKRVASDGFHSAGRLSTRELKYASEAGFNTIVSLHNYDSQIGSSDADGGSYLPTSEAAKDISENLAGVKYVVMTTEDWKTVETVAEFGDLTRSYPAPYLVESENSYAATFVILAHLANVTRHQQGLMEDETEISAEDVFKIGVQLGFDFGKDAALRSTVFDLTASELPDELPVPDVTVKNWYEAYWWMKPIYKNIFDAGQILRTHLGNISAAGVTTIVNSRKGVTMPGDVPSQEEVTLLNIRLTDTYDEGGRQTTSRLEATRIDPTKPTSYISSTSQLNYEARNALEFGDDIGYNEGVERETIKTALPDVNYVHLPIGGRHEFSVEMWAAYKDRITEAYRGDPTLFHCTSGFRTSVLGILSAAYLYCLPSDWARDRALQVGYFYDDVAPEILTVFEKVLDDREDKGACLGSDDVTEGTPTASGASVLSETSRVFWTLLGVLGAMINNL